MSSTTKPYEEKMNNCVAHLSRELATIRAGRANPRHSGQSGGGLLRCAHPDQPDRIGCCVGSPYPDGYPLGR